MLGSARPLFSRLRVALVFCICFCTWPVRAFPTVRLATPRSEPAALLFEQQMHNPSEAFSVLLIIGGDIIQKAIAQLSGRRVTFLSFSFGWVAYAFGALMSAFGDAQFMPSPDYPASVIEMSSRNKKASGSWVIGRLIRDLENAVEDPMDSWEVVPNDGGPPIRSGEWDSGLIISIYETLPGAGTPKPDRLDWSFFLVFPVQLIVAAIPWITDRDWSILTVTIIGTGLAVITGSMRQWRFEKFHCRKNSGSSYIFTRGNGYRHVLVIQADANKSGLYLDDLAAAATHTDLRTRILSVTLAFMWLAFLIVAGGLKEHTWYLLVVGALGMVQNVAVAGLARKPASHGIPLSEVKETFGKRVKGEPRPRVMDVLYKCDDAHPGMGQAIRPEFFPDFALRPNEIQEWNRRENELYRKKAEKKKVKKLAEQKATQSISPSTQAPPAAPVAPATQAVPASSPTVI